MTDSERYAKPMLLLHWVMLLIIAAVFASIEAREFFEKGTEAREFMKNLHYMLGLSVLFLVGFRLVLKWALPVPPILPPPGTVMKLLAKTMHVLLYLLMIGMPVAGWLILSAGSKPIPFFGLELPALMTENKDLADEIKTWHKTAGNIAYYLIAAHALAALYHHYVRRDNTLRRMLPYKSRN